MKHQSLGLEMFGIIEIRIMLQNVAFIFILKEDYLITADFNAPSIN